ncbi:DUF4431 domain-containing protein [Mesorhizobium sp. NZP2077]|nr:DUF4431 domain-containing protein [Mesorhizobium sp. NZP2077]
MMKTTLAFVFVTALSWPAAAACLDLSKQPAISASGELIRPMFAGPPNFEDVRKGDAPEPSYILALDSPFCVTGDDFLEDGQTIDRIQLLDDKGILLKLVGHPIEVTGNDPFGAHTGHHHAPLLMDVVSASLNEVPADASLAQTTVEAFYLYLETGDGASAAMNVVPEKRGKGPFSAAALTKFYGNLKRPLKLLGVTQSSENRFRAKYTFETQDGKVCNGSSIVTTKQASGMNLVASIKVENGC